MRVLIVPSTLRGGAKRCITVALEASSAAHRVAGLPSPEGMPGEAKGQLHAAAAQLQRSSASAQQQSAFLVTMAQRGLVADGPFGSLLDLLGPQLRSPWAPPPEPKKVKEHHWSDGPLNLLDGAKDELVGTVKGVGHTGLGIAAHAIDGDIPGIGVRLPGVRPSDQIHVLRDERRNLDGAAKWAKDHPGKFLTLVGRDLIAYDDHAKGDHSHGYGRNLINILGLLAPISKAGSAAKAAKAAGAAKDVEGATAKMTADARATREAAQRDRYTVGRRPADGETPAEYRLRRQRANNELTRTTGLSRLAEDRLQGEVQAAREAAEHAHEVKIDALKNVGEAGANTGGQGAAQTLGSHPK